MNCYYCETERSAGGTHYAHPAAVAICMTCGAGLCARHAKRTAREIRCPEHVQVNAERRQLVEV